MELIYTRLFLKRDTYSQTIPRSRELHIASRLEPHPTDKDQWGKVILFVDTDKDTIVDVPFRTRLEIDKKEYVLKRPELFAAPWADTTNLDLSIFYSTLCLEDKKGILHDIKDFTSRNCRIIRKGQD